MRPVPAIWFEVLCARGDVALAAEALGRSGAVELEIRPGAAAGRLFVEKQDMLRQFADLARQYRPYWPACAAQGACPMPAALLPLEHLLQRLHGWAELASSIASALQCNEAAQADLVLWRELFLALESTSLDFSALAQAGPVLRTGVILPPRGVELVPPASIFSIGFHRQETRGLLVVGARDGVDALARLAAEVKCRVLDIPPWARGDARACAALASLRRIDLEAQENELRSRLTELNQRFDLASVLGALYRQDWFAHHVGSLEASENLCRMTGWSNDPRRMLAVLKASGARALTHFPPAPAGMNPPLLLRNPTWARPFQLFSVALGMPGRNETDPSSLLAFIVPLLFGYMFGDIGQGLVLCVIGWLLRRRWPAARILVACGISAMLFGALFGSVFSLEHLFLPVWLRPLQAPLLILGLPLVVGGLLIALGQALNGVEAWWRGETKAWLVADAPVLVIYCGALLGFLHDAGWVMAGAGLIAYLAGHIWTKSSLALLVAAIGSLVEKGLQLVVNTLSFARVGAFALAHAGLSAAVTALAESGESAMLRLFILVLGNVLITALEGLIVTIQTTRLMLFEFFIRFMRGEGRMFRPLPVPTYLPGANKNEIAP